MDLQDSGDRTEQYGGATRDREPGKGRFDLLSPFFLQALARLAEAGAAKYAERNWEKGYSTALCADSMVRHAMQYLGGDRTEDHLAAVAWNAMAAWHVTKMVEDGHLPRDLVNHLPLHVDQGGDYTTEVGGQMFTRAQWEAVQGYIDGRVRMLTEGVAALAPEDREAHSRLPVRCARCGHEAADHRPGGIRVGCAFAGVDSRSTCRWCRGPIVWDGDAWRGGDDPGDPRLCRETGWADGAHVPVEGGDLRG